MIELLLNFYEKCFHSCKFCSLRNSLSSNSQHNCLTCNEGYLRSYEYMGNCYKIEYPKNNSNYYKIVSNKDEENYTLVNNSYVNEISKYIIISTGEYASKCPNETVFHTYTYKYQNFKAQTNTPIGKMYPLTLEKAPKYLFNNICYQACHLLLKKMIKIIYVNAFMVWNKII